MSGRQRVPTAAAHSWGLLNAGAMCLSHCTPPPLTLCSPLPPTAPGCRREGVAKVGDVGMAKIMAGDYVTGVVGTLAW